MEFWVGADTLTSSRVLYVEARSALAAALRARRVSRAMLTRARRRLEDLAEGIAFVELGPAIALRAGGLAERHGLRANDAIHLASALSLLDSRLIVVSWDVELRRAALEAGLAIAPAAPPR